MFSKNLTQNVKILNLIQSTTHSAANIEHRTTVSVNNSYFGFDIQHFDYENDVCVCLFVVNGSYK